MTGYLSQGDIDFRSMVTEFCNKGDFAKAEWNAVARLSQDLYRGDGYKFLSRSGFTLQIVAEPTLFNGPFSHALASAVDIQTAIVMAYKMNPECVAYSDDADDQMSAQAGTKLLRDHYTRNNIAARNLFRSLMVALTGLHFVRVSYDPSQLGTLALYPDEQERFEAMTGLRAIGRPQSLPDGRSRITYMLGGTREDDIHGGLVIPEIGAERWQDVTRFAVVEYPTVTELRAQYPEFAAAGLIQPIGVQDTRTFGSYDNTWSLPWFKMDSMTGNWFSSAAGIGRKVEWWEKSGGVWDRRVLVGMEMVVVEENRGMPINPYIAYSQKTADCLFRNAKPVTNDMLTPIYTANTFLRSKISVFNGMPKNVIIIPDTSEQIVTNDYEQIYRFDPSMGPAAHPQFVPMNPILLTVIGEMAREAEQRCYDVANIPASLRGITGDRVSGTALKTAIDVADTPIQQIRNTYMECDKMKCRALLKIMQEKYTFARILAPSGNVMQAGMREFSGSDILGGTDVDIALVQDDPSSKARRADFATQLAPFMQPGMESMADRMESFIEGGTLKAIEPREKVLSESKAVREFEAMMLGRVALYQQPPQINRAAMKVVEYPPGLVYITPQGLPGTPLLTPIDIHKFEIDQHWRDAQSRSTPENVRKMLIFHINAEHKAAMQQEMQNAQNEAYMAEKQTATAQAAGNLMVTLAAAEHAGNKSAEQKALDVKKSPASGGQASGDTRAAKARNG